jgi:hypothetical protein
MGPPNQLKRASSLRQPSRQGEVASVGRMHPLRNASSANTPRTQNGSLPRPQPVSIEPSSVIQRTQSTEQVERTPNSTVETLAKPRMSLHSRSQSVSGGVTSQAHRQWYISAHSRDVSVSSQETMPTKSLRTSGQGQNLSSTAKLTAGKPQFSTYQQHFSPKKALKPPALPMFGRGSDQQHSSTMISETTTNYSAPGDETATLLAQTSRLQDELLQLQMIHDSSHFQQKNYLENTMQKFRVQFAALSRDHRALTAQEHTYYRKSNRVALQQWVSEGDLHDYGKMQTLAQCVQDVSTLTAPDGKLCMAIEQFETWFERMILTSSSRSSGTTLLEYHDILVSPLGQEWHDLVAVLHRKLDHCSQLLNNLGSAREGSGLAMVLDAHKLFVDNLRQELVYSSAIEEVTLQQEQIWIDESIAKITQEDDPMAVHCKHEDVRPGAWNIDMT